MKDDDVCYLINTLQYSNKVYWASRAVELRLLEDRLKLVYK